MITWENSRHFETPPLFFPPNDVWETSAESHSDDVSLPRSWVVLRLWLRICFYQSQTLPWYIVHRISALVPQPSIRGETSGNFGKCWLFFFFFFFSLFNVKNNFDIQPEYVDLRHSVKQAKKVNLEWNNTNCASVFASEVIKCRRTCSSVNNGLPYC